MENECSTKIIGPEVPIAPVIQVLGPLHLRMEMIKIRQEKETEEGNRSKDGTK